MKNIVRQFIYLMSIVLLLASCTNKQEVDSLDQINWESRITDLPAQDSLVTGAHYLSIYSQIYNFSEHLLQDLTVTVSLRNTNRNDTIYINRAEYFNTSGKSIQVYIDESVYLAPLETVEIIIDEIDKKGGSGANFLFDWTIKPGGQEPIFEAVMISMAGAQGLSFVTEGKRIE